MLHDYDDFASKGVKLSFVETDYTVDEDASEVALLNVLLLSRDLQPITCV